MLQPNTMAGRVPITANQLTPASNMNLSPAHQQLSNALQSSLGSQNNLGGLLQALMNNPGAAQQFAGSQAQPFTPQQPNDAFRLNTPMPWNNSLNIGGGGQAGSISALNPSTGTLPSTYTPPPPVNAFDSSKYAPWTATHPQGQ